ncbi:histidinol-phosphate transaminase [Streptomyces sp. NPDC091266]|uniref:histidinol-phosphate transaminase n=1 Tax=Streptomyces sp. NPDC091266 TaxID=3365978 RepID=UPI0038198D89
MTSRRPAYRLSANENPYPPLPSVQKILSSEAALVNRYPDRFATRLTESIAARHDVPPEHIATGAGSVGVLHHLLHAALRDGGEVVHAWPSFEAYPHLTEMCGGVSVPVPLRDHRHDLAAMADALSDRTKVVIVCNPNNPTGTVTSAAALNRFLERVPDDVLVVLDEAYREFVTEPGAPDGIEYHRDRPRLAVLRTFSKAYGLAGLRVGYAVAHEPVAARIRAASVPFGVNALAHTAAVVSLEAEDELMARVAELTAERQRVTDRLRATGLGIPDSQANFLWLPLGDRTAAFADACADAGVSVWTLDGEGARVTVGEPEANDIVVRVLSGLPGA